MVKLEEFQSSTKKMQDLLQSLDGVVAPVSHRRSPTNSLASRNSDNSDTTVSSVASGVSHSPHHWMTGHFMSLNDENVPDDQLPMCIVYFLRQLKRHLQQQPHAAEQIDVDQFFEGLHAIWIGAGYDDNQVQDIITRKKAEAKAVTYQMAGTVTGGGLTALPPPPHLKSFVRAIDLVTDAVINSKFENVDPIKQRRGLRWLTLACRKIKYAAHHKFDTSNSYFWRFIRYRHGKRIGKPEAYNFSKLDYYSDVTPNECWPEGWGRLIISAIPRDNDLDEIEEYCDSFNHPLGLVVSAIKQGDDERTDEYELSGLTDRATPRELRRRGLAHHRINMTDCKSDLDDTAIQELQAGIIETLKTLRRGESVITHCKSGKGRGPMVSVAVLAIVSLLNNGGVIEKWTYPQVAQALLDAYHQVKKVRPQISFDIEQVQSLITGLDNNATKFSTKALASTSGNSFKRLDFLAGIIHDPSENLKTAAELSTKGQAFRCCAMS